MLRNSVLEVLENDPQDEIVITRLEVAYGQCTGRELKDDMLKDGQNYKTFFENGLSGSNGVTYVLTTNARTQLVVLRKRPKPFASSSRDSPSGFGNHPSPAGISVNPYNNFLPHASTATVRQAKVSEIYKACNEELENDQFGEIPLELLEEQVTEHFNKQNIELAVMHTGANFANLVIRASGNHIRGIVRDGKLSRPSNAYPQHNGVPAYDEPPPPYRPPSIAPQRPQETKHLEIFDSDEEDYECDNNTQADPLPQKYSRFSAPCRNARFNGSVNGRGPSCKPGSSLRDYNRPSEDSVKERLIKKYLAANSVHVRGEDEETRVQMNAMRECINLWRDKIENFPELLFMLKHHWLKHRTIDVVDIKAEMLDNLADSSQKFCLDWKMFGITVDDLAPLNLFVRASQTNSNPRGKNQIEVNPLIQLADFLDFGRDNYKLFEIYEDLFYALGEEGPLHLIAERLGKPIDIAAKELSMWSEVFYIDEKKGSVRLRRPFPFFVMCNL